jgi:hypothetical protein
MRALCTRGRTVAMLGNLFVVSGKMRSLPFLKTFCILTFLTFTEALTNVRWQLETVIVPVSKGPLSLGIMLLPGV